MQSRTEDLDRTDDRRAPPTTRRRQKPAALGEAARYGVVGLLNTGITFGIIYVFVEVYAVSPHVANPIAYTTGLVCSFLLNRTYTFRNQNSAPRSIGRFLLAFGLAYAVNHACLALLLFVAPPTVAAGLSMIVFTVLFFLLNKFFVFSGQR